MSLYTFIMDYAGGSYVRQVRASSPKSACLKWAQSLDVSAIKALGERGKLTLVREMMDDAPTPITNTLNVWCATALIRGKVAIVTLIQTEQLSVKMERHNNGVRKNP